MTDEERAIDVAAATPRVNAILHPKGAAITNVAPYEAPQTAPKPNYPLENLVGLLKKPPRAPRSDKGTHRPPKAEQPAGKLSREQVDGLEQLIEEREMAKSEYLKAQERYQSYLDEITA